MKTFSEREIKSYFVRSIMALRNASQSRPRLPNRPKAVATVAVKGGVAGAAREPLTACRREGYKAADVRSDQFFSAAPVRCVLILINLLFVAYANTW
jgi:hypothetical protein